MKIVFCVFVFFLILSIIMGVFSCYYKMKCPKCKGKMVYRFDTYEDCGIWTCTKCGKEVRIYG